MEMTRIAIWTEICGGRFSRLELSWSDPICAGLYFTLRCKRYVFTVSEAASFRFYLKWANLNDIDLELWRDGTLAEASLTCQACGVGAAEELLRTRTLLPGEYELRVTGYELRVETTSYELTVTTPASSLRAATAPPARRQRGASSCSTSSAPSTPRPSLVRR